VLEKQIMIEILRAALKKTTVPENLHEETADILAKNLSLKDTFDRNKVPFLPGTIYKIPVALPDRDNTDNPIIGKMYVTVGGLNGKPLEVFVTIGKSGGDASILSDCMARLISGWLQDGANPNRVLKHLIGMVGSTRVPWPNGGEGLSIKSVPDGVGKAIRKWIGDNNDDGVEGQ